MFYRALIIMSALSISSALMAKEPQKLKVQELFQQKEKIAGKMVQVEGKVVKVNTGIMGKNWVHIQDGSGSTEKKDNDITCTTTKEPPALGTKVQATGKAVTDQKFMMYEYPVLLESAEFKILKK